jgi:hypothetical protein
VNPTWRATPFALLAILALGSGLGIGLGLAEAPTSSRPVLSGPVIPSPPHPAHRPTSALTPGGLVPASVSAPLCTSSSLQLSASAVDTSSPVPLTQGAITLLNVSPASCELSNEAVIELIGSNGAVLVSSASGSSGHDVIQAGAVQDSDIHWENWCGADLEPFSIAVVLPNTGGTLSIAFGNGSTLSPTCIDRSKPSRLLVHGNSGPESPFLEGAD